MSTAAAHLNAVQTPGPQGQLEPSGKLMIIAREGLDSDVLRSPSFPLIVRKSDMQCTNI